MKRVLFLLLAAVAVMAPAAFAAGGDQGTSPAKACTTELKAIGAANFKLLYAPGGSGANAMGKCVAKHAKLAAAARTNAAKACGAEQAMDDAAFRAAHSGKSFAEFYGNNENDKNAFGKCVSAKAHAATIAAEAATLKAAKACKTERAAGKAAFTARYGGKASAFGKCVSAKSKQQ
jgi:hypothetical protein